VSIEPPPEMQRPSRLVELHAHHARSCWRLGEHATLRPEDYARQRVEPVGDTPENDGMLGKKPRSRKKASPVESCVEVICCHTRVDVIWQDGTRDADSSATLFAPAKHVDGYYEFWPQDFVVGKSVGDLAPPVGVVESVNHEQRLCAVTWRQERRREVLPVYEIAPHPDFNFKVGDIVIRLPSGDLTGLAADASGDATRPGEASQALGSNASSRASPVASAVSKSEISGAQPGAYAVRVTEGDSAAFEADGIGDGDEDEADGNGEVTEAGRIGEMMASRIAASGLAWIGEVMIVGPMLRVRWMDGTDSEAAPEELYVVNTDEEEEPAEEEDLGSYDDEEDLDRGSRPRMRGRVNGANNEDESSGWETVSSDGGDDDDISLTENKKLMAAPAHTESHEPGDNNAEGKSDGGPVRQSIALPVPTPLTSLMSASGGVVDSGSGRQGPEAMRAEDEGEEEYDTAEDMDAETEFRQPHRVLDGRQTTSASSAELDAPESGAVAKAPLALATTCAVSALSELVADTGYADIEAAGVETFCVLEGADLSKHHYAGQGSPTAAASSSSKPQGAVYGTQFTRTAQKQWRLLQNGLPPGIYVVAYAERAELLRALIIGPPGTPYQDAVFVFDFQLPPEFPQQPPSVHYVSHGERINPNLYENGKVCLSLLGTWTGKQSCELWNPDSSTVLQVLVSIQALVLCEQPYYNEAGYDKQLGTSEGGHHARRYNEGALLLTLKSMMTTLAHKSTPFEELIKVHFRSARRRILGRCAKLLELKEQMLQNVIAAVESDPDATSSPDPVTAAGLMGVLNPQPTQGFLLSLERMLPSLETAFERFL